MAAVELPPPPDIHAPLHVPSTVTIDVAPLAFPAITPPPSAAGGSRTGVGGGSGGGAGTGTGAGAGPGTGGDEGYIFPPNPRGVIVPPENPPRSVRGQKYRVQFWVNAEGRVERVAVTPEIPDDRYRRDFQQRMLSYRFYPAKTRDGRTVTSVIAISITP
jgi:hypothetical protein